MITMYDEVLNSIQSNKIKRIILLTFCFGINSLNPWIIEFLFLSWILKRLRIKEGMLDIQYFS